MASNRIKGITIEIGGNTTKLENSLKTVDKSLSNTQKQLKDVDKLLKLDPKNTELLRQKQELLGQAVGDTKERLELLKNALTELEGAGDSEKTIEQQNALKREIIATEEALKGYQNELKNSKASLDKFGENAAKAAEKTKKLSAAAAAVGGALIANMGNAAKTADELATLSRNTGISVEELQKMQYASELVDVSVEDMTGSFKKLLSRMNSGSEVFETLGVEITDANGEFRDSQEVWYECLQALSQIENETQRDIVAQELFGKSASELSGIIDDGGEALRQYGDEAEDMGLILSGEAMEGALEMSDTFEKLKSTVTQSLLKMGSALAKTLTPALTKVSKAVEKVAKWFSNLSGRSQKIILIIAAVVAAISPVLSIVSKIAAGVKVLSAVFAALASPVGAIVLALGALVAAGVLVYKNWETIKKKAKELWEKIESVFDTIKTKITGVWDDITTKTSEVWEGIKTTVSTAWTNISTAASTAWDGIKSTVTGVWDTLKTTASTTWETIKTTITDKFDSVKTAITTKVEDIKTKLGEIITKVKGIFDVSNWTLPHIKLPHFKVTGSFGWSWDGGLTYPKLSVEWYKKAMQSGYIFKNPTMIGVGDAGSEVVIGRNNLMNMIRQASAEGSVNYGGVNVVINVDDSITGKRLLDEIETELANRTVRRKAVFG